ncbi:MAG: hypothetical protein QOD56_1968 [Gammaproteobacteria bacterium]|jgi:hypothetical protein|nr:hypothetical protein [Gammaproteobacteria bacterium]
MYRRKVMVAATAIFAIGVAFAAQPISEHAERGNGGELEHAPWVPGTSMLMSAHEPSVAPLAPPP